MNAGMLLGEAVLLGVASGPACVASCGPVLVPSLLAERTGWRSNFLYLGTFLSTRLVGYLLFAVAAAAVGQLASLQAGAHAAVYGAVHIALAAVLLLYARKVGLACEGASCAGHRLVTLGGDKRGVPGAALLGLLTGLSLCPPFLAAGVRAAQLGSVAAAILFFLAFFAGTSVWFIPFAGLGCVRRNEAVITVARMAMVLIAVYYFCAGSALLLGRPLHG